MTLSVCLFAEYFFKNIGNTPRKNVITKSAKINQRKFQLADVIKTHGNNSKVKKLSKINNFTNLDDAIKNTVHWYNKNWKIYN